MGKRHGSKTVKVTPELIKRLSQIFQEEWDMDRAEMGEVIELWISEMQYEPPTIRKRMTAEKMQRHIDKWMMKKLVDNWGLFTHWMNIRNKKKTASKGAMDSLVSF